MLTNIDDTLLLEAALFYFRFSCRDCQHFDEVRERCAEEYPTAEHLRSDLERPDLLFCKIFEGGR